MDVHIHIRHAVFFVFMLKAGEDILLGLFLEAVGLQVFHELVVCPGDAVEGGGVGIGDSDDGIIRRGLPGKLHAGAFGGETFRQEVCGVVCLSKA